jgi:hypothetical protein
MYGGGGGVNMGITFYIENLKIEIGEDFAVVDGIKFNFLRNKFNALEVPLNERESLLIQPKCSGEAGGFSLLPDQIELLQYGEEGEVEYAQILLQKKGE